MFRNIQKSGLTTLKNITILIVVLVFLSTGAFAVDVEIEFVGTAKDYSLSTVAFGQQVYIDRDFEFLPSGLPEEFLGMVLLMSSNNDKTFLSDDELVRFSLSNSAKVFVALDSRVLLPDNSETGDGFLVDSGFVATSKIIVVNGDSYILYEKEVFNGLESLNGQESNFVGTSNYFIIIDDLETEEGELICGNGIVEIGEECDDGNVENGDGCSVACEVSMSEEVYVISYVGDIDGSVSQDWFFFYEMIADFHSDNNIMSGYSFYPGTMVDNIEYENAFLKMYSNNNIELIQKGFLGEGPEEIMEELPFDEQVGIVSAGQDFYLDMMGDYGVTNAILPTTYNHIFAKFNEITRDATELLGFNFYLEMYLGEGLDYVDSTDTYDVTNYAVSVTEDGDSGRFSEFDSVAGIVARIDAYDRDDLTILEFDGVKIIPLYVHQQDFEDAEEENVLDLEKWDIYTELMLRLKNDPKVTLLLPEESFELRRSVEPLPNPIPDPDSVEICQFATSAIATSENSGSLAVNAIGEPDAPLVGQCSEWSGFDYSWSVENWDVIGSIELEYDEPVFASELTVFGDFDSCWSRIWLKNSETGLQTLVYDGVEESCIAVFNFNENLITDSVILETCGWSWSYTDAVELCGFVA